MNEKWNRKVRPKKNSQGETKNQKDPFKDSQFGENVDWKQAIVLSEIIGKPVSRKRRSRIEG